VKIKSMLVVFCRSANYETTLKVLYVLSTNVYRVFQHVKLLTLDVLSIQGILAEQFRDSWLTLSMIKMQINSH
jgi:hypothetical protein